MDGLGFLQSLTADKGHAETITEDDTKLKAKHDAMNKIKNQELNIQSQFNSEFSYSAFLRQNSLYTDIIYHSDLQGLFNDVSIY